MNLRDLRYIVSVADLGRFGLAATACNVSQPTLSGQILKLEDELGVAIFERVGKQVRTTAAGSEILVHARRALAAAADINASARAACDPLFGPIRLGVIPTLAPYLMPYVLPLAAEQLPKARLLLIEDLTGHLLGPLADGGLDAALIATDPENDRLEAIELFDEPFWLVAPADHPLAHAKMVRAEDIDPGELLLLTDGHCLRDQVVALCAHDHRSGSGVADVRAASLETLLQLTAAKYGLTLAPRLAVQNWPSLSDKIVARPISGGHASRRVRLVYRRDMPRKGVMLALAELICAALPECVEKIPTAL
jgi:LysR family hydrogen peroxide-inducible transcriptional activator